MGRVDEKEQRIERWLSGADGGRAATRIAVIGASTDRTKFGNIIVRDLLQKGFTVFAVNPREPEVEGLATHASVADVPGGVHIACFVVPPKVSLGLLSALPEGAAQLAWFQPGAFDAAVQALAAERFGDAVVVGPCIMVEARR